MSDNEKDDFKAININSLDTFDGELSQKSDDIEPDLERFKMLFEEGELKDEEPVSFKKLFSFDKEVNADPFKPLIEGTGEHKPGKGKSLESKDIKEEKQEEIQETEPEISLEEQAFEQGYTKGFDQGLAAGEEKGISQGFEKGFEKGESQGFEKGEPAGFAKGEKDGFDKGFEEGRMSAEAEVQKEVVQILDPLKESLLAADNLLDDFVEKYETRILSLIFKISERVVMATLGADDEVVRNTILDALKSLVAPEEIILNVAPEDYEYIEMIKDDFFEAVGSLKRVAVKSDSLITKGGCKIETATASISTDPESKLLAIHDAIKNAAIKNPGLI